jgi:membrane protease YdiL (CAAX protease family)
MSSPSIASASGMSFLERAKRWAIVRVVVYALVLIAIVVATGLVSRFLVPPAPSPLHHVLLMATNLVSALALLAAYALSVRLLEGRSPTELGLRKGLPLLLVGTLLGLVLIGTVYLILWFLGLVQFAQGTGFDGLLGALVVMFAAATLEELLFRAVLFRIAEEAFGTTAAVVVSAIAFGLVHALNPGATLVSSTAVALEAGVMFSLAYVLTRNLWLPIGIHMSWNFAEGSLFGARVSGYAEPHTLFKTALSGPQLLTGGNFGPEASVIAIGVCLSATVVIAIMVVRRGGWRSATFRLSL